MNSDCICDKNYKKKLWNNYSVKILTNIHMNIIYCFSSCDFWLLYFKQFWNKICFLMCKFFLSVKYLVSDITSFIMQINDWIIYIYNIYFKFSYNYIHINQNLLIFKLLKLFKKSNKYVLIKKFNFYYSI